MAIDRSNSRQADAGYSYGANASKSKSAPSKSRSTDKGDRVGKGEFTSSKPKQAAAKKDDLDKFRPGVIPEAVDRWIPSVLGKVTTGSWFATGPQIRQAQERIEKDRKHKGMKSAEIDKAINTRASMSIRSDRRNRGEK